MSIGWGQCCVVLYKSNTIIFIYSCSAFLEPDIKEGTTNSKGTRQNADGVAFNGWTLCNKGICGRVSIDTLD